MRAGLVLNIRWNISHLRCRSVLCADSDSGSETFSFLSWYTNIVIIFTLVVKVDGYNINGDVVI